MRNIDYTFAFRKFTVLIIALFFHSCHVNYSMTGISLPDNLKTLHVDNLINRSGIIYANLSISLSQTIREFYLERTSLSLVGNKEADIVIEGDIIKYEVSSSAIQSNDLSGLSRLTIEIKLKFTNNKDSEKSFDKTFSRYQDFESNKSLASVANKLIQSIGTQLANDVFNASLSDW